MDTTGVRRLKRRRRLLLRQADRIEEFVRGSVVLMRRKCTYPGCRKCASGERHPTWVLTVSRGGKTHTVYLGQKRLAAARRMTENYRRLSGLMEQIAEVNLALLREHAPGAKGPDHGGTGDGPGP
jgi:hypothetical protein